jgi:hypothetical protein
VLLALDGSPTLTWAPTWTLLDAHPSLTTRYTIDRGRQYELDRTDTGRATVEITDRTGLLDPTNLSSAYAGKLDPLVQVMLGRHNPYDDTWHTRYRGFVEEWDYVVDPSQRFNKLLISLVDIFEVLSTTEMVPVHFGDAPPPVSEGQVYFAAEPMDDRIIKVLTGALIPTEFSVVFSGNVDVKATVYSPGESAMTAVQDAADAEWPGVGNVYTDRRGRICVHGRHAKFDPAAVAGPVSDDVWQFNQWKVGDQAAYDAGVGFARLREFAFNRGLAKIINQGYATPKDMADSAGYGQVVRDTTSQDLITKSGLEDGTTALQETKRFASYYVSNYAQPQNRVTAISFRSMNPATPGAGNTWALLSAIDIADQVDVTVGTPGGGGFHSDSYYVEGIHETVNPLGGAYDDVTVSLDLSPRALFTNWPFPIPSSA